jgi:hypothetical protein
MISLRTLGLLGLLATVGTLGACTTTSSLSGAGHNLPGTPVKAMTVATPERAAEPHYASVGGKFLITWYQGFPGRTSHAVHVSAADLDDIAWASDVCYVELKPQQPGAPASVGVSTVAGVVSGVGGFALGVGGIDGITGSSFQNGIGQTAGGGIVGGLVNGPINHARSKRFQLGTCVGTYVNDGARSGDFKPGIHVQPDEDNVDGSPISSSFREALGTPHSGPPAPSVNNDQQPK